MDNKTIICSGALVYARSTKRFLLLHRTQGRAKDVWGLVGGTNEKAETPWEGLRREIFEEIGKMSLEKNVYIAFFEVVNNVLGVIITNVINTNHNHH